MGFLTDGTPLKWDECKQFQQYVRDHGIIQFINIFNRCKDRNNDVFLWGDEVESTLIALDPDTQVARLSLRGNAIIDALRASIQHIKRQDGTPFHANFIPEYGRHMIEATPGAPYGGTTADLRLVEVNMRIRRKMVEELLRPHERIVTIGSFPLMGVGEFTLPAYEPMGPVANSPYIPDELISLHPRFATLTENIRVRRGSNVDIRIPLFQDENTAELAAAELEAAGGELPYDPAKEVYMDAMAFGMGSSCLQVTFQARHIREARHLYDHLAVLSPIFLALTASTPFYHGKVTDNDVRWTVISQSVDDRTPEERGEQPLAEDSDARVINKSRYDSIDSYLSLEDNLLDEYDDLDLIYDEAYFNTLVESGIDERLARHIAHLFIRDPLVIYGEHVEIDDIEHSDHFENIQSTNWQTVRFKPPPPGTTTGWRVEFRTMEIQLTDFENAAFTVFIALLSRAILFFDLNFYIPISKNDENLATAHKRDAARQETFHFRKVVQNCRIPQRRAYESQDYFKKMTMREIVLGDGADFPGLVPIVRGYLDIIKCDPETHAVVDPYLDLIAARARGELLTTAQWHREFVRLHPDYKHDSAISSKVCYDWILACHGVSQGTIDAPQLLGRFQNMKSHVDALLNPLGDDDPLAQDSSAAAPAAGSADSARDLPSNASIDLDLGCEAVRRFLDQYAAAEQQGAD